MIQAGYFLWFSKIQLDEIYSAGFLRLRFQENSMIFYRVNKYIKLQSSIIYVGAFFGVLQR